MKRQAANSPSQEDDRKRPARRESQHVTIGHETMVQGETLLPRDSRQQRRDQDALNVDSANFPPLQEQNPGFAAMPRIGGAQEPVLPQPHSSTSLVGSTFLGYPSSAEILAELASRRAALFPGPSFHLPLGNPSLLQANFAPRLSGHGNSADLLNLLLLQQQSVPMSGTASLLRSSLNDQIRLAAMQQQNVLSAQSLSNARDNLQWAQRGESKEAEIPATGRTQAPKGIPLCLPSDARNLSEYQVFIRKQIEIFEADEAIAASSAQGRNRPVVIGQVGVRCIYCAQLPFRERPKGAVYFPSKLTGLYQASQNMQMNHFSSTCQLMPAHERKIMFELKDQRSSSLGGGKQYWTNAARVLGIYETENEGLRLSRG